MHINGKTQLRRMVLSASVPLLTVAFAVGCNQANFGGDSKNVGGNPNKAKGAGAFGTKDGPGSSNADHKRDPSAHGTPETSDISRPGWAQNDSIKGLVDALFRNGSIPTLGGTGPNLGGQDNNTFPNPGGPLSGGQSDNTSGPSGAPGGNGSDSGSKGSLFSDSDGVLWVPCAPNAQDGGTFKSEFFAKDGARVRVAGEFCPQVKLIGDVTVLFIIDHSGSMEGTLVEGPNDKTSGGTCGRLRSAQVVIDKYKAMPDATVQVGVVNFASTARTDVAIGPLGALPLSSNVFCGSDALGLTNYYAAFSQAASVLASIPGKKLVYFISDGSPTIGLGDPRGSGLDAALALRQIPELTLYALFVGYSSGLASNPQGYLEQLTGDPKAVRVTANAQELVQAAASLGQPPVGINKADVLAQVSNGTSTVDVKIDRFEPRKDVPNRYYWVTEPFALSGQAGAPELNSLTVTATTSFGYSIKSTAEISYTMTPP